MSQYHYVPEPFIAFSLRHLLATESPKRDHKNMRKLDATLPSVCVRHGNLGTWSFTAFVPSRPSIPWDDLSIPRKILSSIGPWAGRDRIAARRSRTIRAETHWSVCPTCRWYVFGRRVMSLVLVALTAVIITGPISPLMEWIHEGPRSLLLIVGIALAIPTIRSLSIFQEITRALTSEDGTELVIRNPHPAFVQEAITLGANRYLPEATPAKPQ